MNVADWFAIAVVAVTALVGIRRGLVTGVLSLVGLIGGAAFGAEAAPKLLGDLGGYVPIVALFGAAVGGMVGQMAGIYIGRTARQAFSVIPPLRVIDSAGGVALGAVMGLAFCWVMGAAALYTPGQSELRRLAQESLVLSTLTEAVPPERVIDAVGKIDPFGSLAGPDVGVAAPDPEIATAAGVRGARFAVVRVRGLACGLGVEGSGWIVRRGLVVTNAHVVAGVRSPVVDRGEGTPARRGQVVAFDADNDLALVRVDGLTGRPLPLGEAGEGLAGALLGFPLNGPYAVTPVRLGGSARIAARDAYGRVQLGRQVIGLRGNAREGNSGGPIVDEDGRVIATLFAKREGVDDQGYAVPNGKVEAVLESVGPPLETACVAR